MSNIEDYPGPSHDQPIEDYPGPTHDQPEKSGQDPRGRANEEMVKPPARPEAAGKKERARRPGQKKHIAG